ncbi:MAG: PilX N-terminal domain-containing pilus assembly protein [Candidatus Bruticola sp.]
MLKDKRGIVLITTMLTVVLIIMLLSSVVYSNLGGMRLASNFYGREEALMAAQSGIQYAITRLQDDITWRAADYKTVSETSKGLEVIEKNGNVLGCITTANGNRSFFRLKFNYEDGANGLDGLNNSGSSELIASPYVSVNNLFNSTPTKVYTASADGTTTLQEVSDSCGIKHTEAVGSLGFRIGKGSCYLIAEGFAGNSLRDLDLKDVASLRYSEFSGQTSIRSEAYLTLDSEEQFTDSVASAAGDLTITADLIRASNAKGSTSPKMRTLNSATIDTGLLDMSDGEIVSAKSSTIKVSNPAKSNYTVSTSRDSSNFAQITWESIQDKCKGKTFNKVAAGTYCWEKDPSDQSGKANILFRYDGNFPPGTTIPADTAKTKVTAKELPGVEIDFDSQTMKISGNLSVASNGETSSFIVRYDKESGASRPIVAFLEDDSGNYPLITSDNNIFIEGATLGGGSIISAGNISLQGPSILESDPGVGVSVYAKGDVNLLPIEDVTETVKKAELETSQLAESDPTMSAQPGNNKNYDVKLEDAGAAQNKFNDAKNAYKTLMSSYASAFRENGFSNYTPFYDDRLIDTYFNEFYEFWYDQGATMNFSSGKGPKGWEKEKFSDVFNKAFESAFDFDDLDTTKGGTMLSGLTQINDFGAISESKMRDINQKRQEFKEKAQDLINYLKDRNNWSSNNNGRGNWTNRPSISSSNSAVDFSPSNMSNVMTYVDQSLVSQNFRENKQSQLNELMIRYGEVKYSDQDISGVIYAWRNININIGANSNLNLTGAMVAYGGNPNNSTPGNGEGGQIKIDAKAVGMTLDPDYMGAFISTNARRKLKQIMFSSF